MGCMNLLFPLLKFITYQNYGCIYKTTKTKIRTASRGYLQSIGELLTSKLFSRKTVPLYVGDIGEIQQASQYGFRIRLKTPHIVIVSC